MLLLMLAEGTAAFDPSTLTAPLSAIGSIGFAVWYAYYVTTVAMPKMQDAHVEERKQARLDFTASLEAARKDYLEDSRSLLAEMKEQRAQFQAWMTDRKSVQI